MMSQMEINRRGVRLMMMVSIVMLMMMMGTMVLGEGVVSRKEYQLGIEEEEFYNRDVGVAKLEAKLKRIGTHADAAFTPPDANAVPKEQHFIFTQYDTPDRRFRENGIVIRMKSYRDALKPKYYVIFKVNGIDPDTLWPPLALPAPTYKHKYKSKLEQDLHQNYTKFAQSTTVKSTTVPQLKNVRDLKNYFTDIHFDWIDWDAPLRRYDYFYVWKREYEVKFAGHAGGAVIELYFPHGPHDKPVQAEFSMRVMGKDSDEARSAHRVYQLMIDWKLNAEAGGGHCTLNIGPLRWPNRKTIKVVEEKAERQHIRKSKKLHSYTAGWTLLLMVAGITAAGYAVSRYLERRKQGSLGNPYLMPTAVATGAQRNKYVV